MGTRALYDFVHENPSVEFLPTEYVNDPFVIARQEKMVAINAAIEVDIAGQVCADSIGERFYSGIGGQVDFLCGDDRLAATTAGRSSPPLHGHLAGWNPDFKDRLDAAVRRGRRDQPGRRALSCHRVGVASLHGKSVRERALALIQIAHPDSRAEPIQAAKTRHLIPVIPTDPPGCGLRVCAPETLVTRDHSDVEDIRSFPYPDAQHSLLKHGLLKWVAMERASPPMQRTP